MLLKVIPNAGFKVVDANVIVTDSAAPVAWDGGTIYNVGDTVTHDGKTWRCNQYAGAGYGPFGGYLDGTAPGYEGIIYWTEY
jgi:hypothetical protein